MNMRRGEAVGIPKGRRDPMETGRAGKCGANSFSGQLRLICPCACGILTRRNLRNDFPNFNDRRVVLTLQDNENLSPQNMDDALAEIERTLGQMLLLAQLSASDMDVDREALQKTLERLKDKIDRIADLM